mmetsp:Transcript_44709/g.117226  ORF Transcript_44709/g.117226 Transcript_44709/m.117226 type:complete len:82 (+) Transcript_44709:945-1190(+)
MPSPGEGVIVTLKWRHVASLESESARHRGSTRAVFGSRSFDKTNRQLASAALAHEEGTTARLRPICEATPGGFDSITMALA